MRQRLLLIDDDDRVAHLLVRCLTPEFEVLTADSGTAGLEQYRKHKPPLVVLDIMLPDMCGTEVLKALCAEEMKPFIVMLSGNPDLGLARETIKLGAADYVVKPFHPDHLRDILRSAARRAAP
jgi:DNA-binding response OmpR family regulator